MRFGHVLYALILFLPASLWAQKITIRDGKVLVKDSVYCIYDTYSAPDEQKNNFISKNESANGDWQPADLVDFNVSTPDSEKLIIARAKVLASSTDAYLKYYYSIKILPLAKDINIECASYQMEYFLRDLVKYHVFKNGQWDDSAGNNLYNAWTKKIGAISDEVIDRGTVTNYNLSKESTVRDDLYPGVVAKDSNIYNYDSVIATYKPMIYNLKQARRTGKADKYYIIDNKAGKQIGSVLIIKTRSQAYLWVGNDSQAFSLISADKSEGKILGVAAKVLMLEHVL